MAWTITLDGQVFREGDLTIDEAEKMEVATNLTWRQLNPIRSAAVAKGIAVVLFQTRLGLPEADAKKRVGEMKIDDFIDLIGTYDPDEDMPAAYDDGFPQSADETSTPT